MDASLEKFKEDSTKFYDAMQMRDHYAGKSLLLSELIEELKVKKELVDFQFNDWGKQVKLYQQSLKENV